MSESSDEIPQGVRDRISTITTARNEATAAATAATARADGLAADLATAQEAAKGADALTASNLDLQAKLADSASRYGTLKGMVEAGFTDQEDRDLAEFYHAKSGVSDSIEAWASALSTDTAPRGLRHMFSETAPTPPPETPPTEAAPPVQRLPDSSVGTHPPPAPQGQVTAEMIRGMSDAQYAEYRKAFSDNRPKRR